MPVPRFGTLTLLALSLLSLSIQAKNRNGHVKVIYSDSKFKPRIPIINRITPVYSKAENSLRNLLGRQVQTQACPTDYDLCANSGGIAGANSGGIAGANSGCCPSGGDCCSDGASGCCATGHQCVMVDGIPGCCTPGGSCTSIETLCNVHGYYPCPDSDVCCPNTLTCTRKTDCVIPNNAPTPTPTPPVVPIPDYTLEPFRASTGAQKLTNITFTSTDPSLNYTKCVWSTDPGSGCPGTNNTRSCSRAGGTVTFQFTGTAVFLYLAKLFNSQGMIYTVRVDGVGDTDVVNSGSAPLFFSSTNTTRDVNDNPNCGIQWSRFGLRDTQHTLQIQLWGAALGSTSTLEPLFVLRNMIVTSINNSSSVSDGRANQGVMGSVSLEVVFAIVMLSLVVLL